MQGEMPFYEDELDALRDAVRALGGTKAVGKMLWNDKTIDRAMKDLADALNPSRNEKLALSQVMFILRAAKDAGHHAPFLWIAGDIGYEAKPVTRAEEVDRLTSVIDNASKTLNNALLALQRVQQVQGQVDGRPVVRVPAAAGNR